MCERERDRLRELGLPGPCRALDEHRLAESTRKIDRRDDLGVGEVPDPCKSPLDISRRRETRRHLPHLRTWPSPSITYFTDVSSRRPIGPRACSFWVEIPISAPSPSSPPSTNRVDAFTSTAAASTSRTKRPAASRSRVTIASEWPVE